MRTSCSVFSLCRSGVGAGSDSMVRLRLLPPMTVRMKKAQWIRMNQRMMTMKNDPKISRGTMFRFPTICPTISEEKSAH